MPASQLTVTLTKGRDRPVRLGHPWIFSGAIARWEGDAGVPGAVTVRTADGEWLASGIANRKSKLAVRVLSRRENEIVDEALIADRLDRAVTFREQLFKSDETTNAYRLVFSEADGLSGLIVDRYADTLSIRVGAAAWVPWLPFIRDQLIARTGAGRVAFAVEADAVEREGLDEAAVRAASQHVRDHARILESGFLYNVSITGGQKTGFYLDQREARQRVARYAAGREVLSAYCYTGAFELHAARAGAKSIIGLDTSRPALQLAQTHHELNGLKTPIEYRETSVPVELRKFRDEGRSFDLIILDPPRFVATPGQLEKGMRAYKDINLLALKLLRPDGILATFSCSGWVTSEHLRLALSWATTDARRDVQILESIAQPPDHPILTAFPEGNYLHGLIARAL
ncbi:MAG: class I SAM-dependent rRNA methyltransferase [Kiritimatiellae bacterium]|nr:class I SAM-dependent rRNA methyltransferase [Kiritimatiellia bacterium]